VRQEALACRGESDTLGMPSEERGTPTLSSNCRIRVVMLDGTVFKLGGCLVHDAQPSHNLQYPQVAGIHVELLSLQEGRALRSTRCCVA